ncbi:MAG: hypothetical protein J5590_00695 [Clostridia bacterium]|nr:hypothetical protein [Clostridia bacterium]
MKKLIALLLSVGILMSFSGCGKKKMLGDEPSAGLPMNFNEEADNYDIIDDMPDYTGDNLDLVVWYGYGTGEKYKDSLATDDKFRDEIERVTGVRLSDESYDNNGKTADQLISEMAASEDFPQVAMGIETSAADKFIEKDMLFDLSEYIPKYMPHYWKIISENPDIMRQWENTQPEKGTFYLKRFHNRAFQFTDPEGYEAGDYSRLVQPVDSRNWVWVRDDILKQIYPNAKTQKEIKAIYEANGAYTKEDMSDVTIKSSEEFKQLLEKINALNITENGKKVWPFYTREGVEDYFNLFTMFGTTLAGAGTGGDVVSDYTYFDGNRDEIVVTAEQPWFKDLCKYFNGLYREGLASKDAIADDETTFNSKLKNGEYAVIYGYDMPPTDEELEAAGKNFSYRKVMIDIPCDYNEFVRRNDNKNAFDSYNMVFFKTSMTGTQLEQALRFIDFFYTEPGMKLANWGPKKAGLYEETDKGFRYTDERYEKAQLYSADPKVYEDYGLYSFPRIDYFIYPDGINKYQPEIVYGDDFKQQPSDWVKYWNYSFVEGEEMPDFPYTNFAWQIYTFAKYCEPAKTFWDARDEFENALGRVVVAASDDEFEKAYSNLLDTIHRNGLDEEGMKIMNETMKERCGDTYEELVNWTSDK